MEDVIRTIVEEECRENGAICAGPVTQNSPSGLISKGLTILQLGDHLVARQQLFSIEKRVAPRRDGRSENNRNIESE